MTKYAVQPTGREVFFDDEGIIVSKTDLKGRITYANDVFIDVAGYSEAELLGQPHSIVRHPDMPRCVFKLLWDVLHARQEIFAYVKNMTKYGDHYWVFAHVTPSLNDKGEVISYHSNRRVPTREALAKIEPIYQALLAEEQRHANAKEGMNAAFAVMVDTIKNTGMAYEEFVFTL
ncbi:PAS domain-containing protein [Rhodospirillaceae bacterium KN72]|uniref:PAS domain-containing protein n=1 Tax=Pacificispira spongiicola TaxID=2729598 RepID=A0A7Y0E2J2_9PROT|nr:PAS domain-containing protein [Pacificispira spongiicola]NMM45301.1 PAS domain-containing protein [Pacificispira spongiicola]